MSTNSSSAEVSYLVLEAGVTVVTLLVAFLSPRLGARFFQPLERAAGRLAARPRLALLVIAVAAPLIRLALLPVAPIPVPERHDEFSFLLAADTFSSGRLTNPTHPMWTHFETFHEEHKPTYMSMYPPAQGLILAAGKVLFGEPWYAVCITIGLMCAAIYWMLLGWLPPRWALLGGAIAILRIGIFSYWMNSYWGGAVSAIGGALVLGALPRLMRKPRAGSALLLALGLILLANSRPFEGFILSLPVAAALGMWLRSDKRPPVAVVLRRVALPASIVLLLGVIGMGYYNWRVFGRPTTLPYQVNRATYAISPVFLWQSPGPEPQYHHKVMRDFYTSWELPMFQRARTLSGFLGVLGTKLEITISFFLGSIGTIPLIMLPNLVRDRRVRFLLLAGAVFALGLVANAFTVAHYLAPATSLLYALLLQSMRHLRQWRPDGQPVGLFLVRAIPALSVVLCAVHIARVPLVSARGTARASVEHQLESLPGRQLAIVRYAPEHEPLSVEWVYNAAAIDSAKVVWAREMDHNLDRELLAYFKDRNVWLVEPDCWPPKVSRYAF